MQATTDAKRTTSDDLDVELARLAAAEPGDTCYLSCYLDARQGPAACDDFLASKAELIRSTLEGTARLDFENALTMIERELERGWHPSIQGLALFAQGPAGGRFLSVLRFALPLDNRLVMYRVPEILPLLALKEQAARFSLLLARRSGLQLLDVDLGAATPKAWAVDRRHSDGSEHPAGRGADMDDPYGPIARLGGPRHLIRRAVSACTDPLLLAGDSIRLEDLGNWLPRRAAARLVATLELPSRIKLREAVALARDAFMAAMRQDGQRLAGSLVKGLRRSGQAVAGEAATLEALRAGRVATLVVAEGGLPADGPGWFPQLELGRIACRQGVPVVSADSDELRYLGGVGCLLRQRRGAIAMRAPARPGRLELVA